MITSTCIIATIKLHAYRFSCLKKYIFAFQTRTPKEYFIPIFLNVSDFFHYIYYNDFDMKMEMKRKTRRMKRQTERKRRRSLLPLRPHFLPNKKAEVEPSSHLPPQHDIHIIYPLFNINKFIFFLNTISRMD